MSSIIYFVIVIIPSVFIGFMAWLNNDSFYSFASISGLCFWSISSIINFLIKDEKSKDKVSVILTILNINIIIPIISFGPALKTTYDALQTDIVWNEHMTLLLVLSWAWAILITITALPTILKRNLELYETMSDLPYINSEN